MNTNKLSKGAQEAVADEHREQVKSLVASIFELLGKRDPPLGVAAEAVTIALVQIALKVPVRKKELLNTVSRAYVASVQVRGQRGGN